MSVTERQAALDVSYPANAAHVPAIRRAVATVARRFGASADALVQINLAVTEAATNAVVHAYRDRPPARAGRVHVVVALDAPGCLGVRVRDHGVGLSPRPDSPGLGLGLGLMAHKSDRLDVRAPSGGGTEVALRFRL
jgi:serine/threonine-protein kinase RsbW/stage II sporulation protein AB (anti-sigma F factor)